ncbi:MAG: LysM peptidoglycan-binding domain-containing protein [Limisphaerales bacterium]
MRWRLMASISLGVNVLLGVLWWAAVPPFSAHHRAGVAEVNPGDSVATRTNIVLRRQFFTWQEVESPDYPTYIGNLRGIGCPEQTIRDIIIADVNALYARKLATELVTPEQQWWRSEPDTNVMQIAEDTTRKLDDERHALLTRLLGTNWETGDLVSLPRPSHPGVVLDGPVLGNLPADTKQTIQDINARSETRLQAYLDAQRQAGKPVDPAELAKIRAQTRNELAGVLSPGQLEEYLLRYSQYANDLRAEFGQLQYFNATSEEFRAIFRGTDALQNRIDALGDSNDPSVALTRQQLEQQKELAIKTALGPQRYQEYQLLQDPLYRDAVAQADQAGTPDAAKILYQINLAAAATQQSIQSNTNLTDQQKAIELKQMELDQLRANAIATGRQLPPEPPLPPQFPSQPTYTLRPGDTPATIAMIYGVPESAILAANPNVNFNNLQPGDSIHVPRSALPPGMPQRTLSGP